MKQIKFFVISMLFLGIGFASAQMMNTSQMMGPSQGDQMMGPNQGGQMMGPNQGNYIMGPNQGGQIMGPNQGGQMMSPNQGGQIMGPNQGNYMMGPNQGGQMMGPNNQMMYSGGDGEEAGPPPEVKAREAREFKMIKNEAKKFEKMVTVFDRQIAQLRQKYNAELPPECGEAIITLKDIVTAIKSAEGFEDIMDKMQDIGTTMDTMQQCMQTAELIKRAPQAFKQAEKELSKLTKEFNRIKNSIVKAGIDVSALAETETMVSNLQASLNKIKEDFKVNPEAIEDFQQDFFPVIGDAWQNVDTLRRLVDGIKKIKPFLKNAERDLKNITKRITSLQKKNIDISEVQQLAVQLKAQLGAINTLISEKNYEDLDSEMMNYFELKNELDSNLGELQGEVKGEYIPQGFEDFFQQKVEVPKSFQTFMQPQSSVGGMMTGGGEVNPMGESNPQPSPGPTMQQNPGGAGGGFLEKLTPQQQEALTGNILNILQILRR